MKTYYFFLPFFLLLSCTLNSEQERTLNAALTRYIEARNEGKVTITVACTYPPAVAHYTALGDSAFKSHYDLSSVDETPILRDGSQIETMAEGNRIQVKYSFKQANVMYGAYENDNITIMALSDNDGKTWFFLDEDDYWNNNIVEPSKRLLSK